MSEDSLATAPDGIPVSEPEAPEVVAPVKGTPTIEELAEKLEATNQRLHDAQAKISEQGEANAELRGQLSVRNTPAEPVEERVDPFAGLDEDEVLTNPMQIVTASRMANEQLVGDVAAVIQDLQREFRTALAAQSPERHEYASQIAELKADPDLKDLPDAALLKIAKRAVRIAPKDVKVLPDPVSPKGIPGGGGKVKSGPSTEDVRKSPLFAALYPDYKEPEAK